MLIWLRKKCFQFNGINFRIYKIFENAGNLIDCFVKFPIKNLEQ